MCADKWRFQTQVKTVCSDGKRFRFHYRGFDTFLLVAKNLPIIYRDNSKSRNLKLIHNNVVVISAISHTKHRPVRSVHSSQIARDRKPIPCWLSNVQNPEWKNQKYFTRKITTNDCYHMLNTNARMKCAPEFNCIIVKQLTSSLTQRITSLGICDCLNSMTGDKERSMSAAAAAWSCRSLQQAFRNHRQVW